MSVQQRLLIISDFNADILAGLINNDPGQPSLAAVAVGFGRALSALLDSRAPYWRDQDALLLWTRPEGVSEEFARALRLEAFDVGVALREVDGFCDAVLAASAKVRTTLAVTWLIPDSERGHGMLDLRADLGVRYLLARMNLRLMERLDDGSGVFVLDAFRWFVRDGAFSPKLWFLAKTPYAQNVFKAAVLDINAALRGVAGAARKVVVCDLDGTLWGGIVGDLGWENLRLGGHDPVGEAFVEFQRCLQALSRRGILLAIVSKNTEAVALEAIDKHPEMVLRREYFAAWRINWGDKAKNIVELMAELNLGLDSVVFLDDNPTERARVREAVPGVLVPDLPEDKMLYPDFLRRLDCFDAPVLSDEDRTRTLLYQAERGRREDMRQNVEVGPLDNWLRSLAVKVRAAFMTVANRQRVVQLFNKTNQMNLSTRRLNEAELVEWARAPNRRLWTFRVSDKYGDSGLTGIASIEVVGGVAQIVDYILSCRVMGRRVEEAMVHRICRSARDLGAVEIFTEYHATGKNKPCLDFWLRSGFAVSGGSRFSWNLAEDYPLPEGVELVVEDA